MLIRRYSELRQLETMEERFKYLRIGGIVGDSTFGFNRYLNQTLYKTQKWRTVRDEVIIRDGACDMGLPDYPIRKYVVIHHMNPLTIEDIQEGREWVFDPEYLICVSDRTHKAIHYGDESLLPKDPVDRVPNDTCPWK